MEIFQYEKYSRLCMWYSVFDDKDARLWNSNKL